MEDPVSRHLIAGPRGRLAFEEYLPLLLCAAGVIGVLPFAIVRLLNGEWWIALLDSVIVAAFATLGIFVLRSRRVRFASISITVLCLSGFVATLHLMGPQQIVWGYPALVVAFYLLKLKEAVAATVLTLVIIVPILIPQLELFTLISAVTTMIVTSVFAYVFAALTRDQRKLLIDLATCDPLTGAGNRRALVQKMDDIIARHERDKVSASLILLDLDDFKAINDEFGHAVGDDVLVRFAEVIKLRIRQTDSFYRFGGEEFVILMDGQQIEPAVRLAEQLRLLVEANELVANREVTISLGVAELQNGESADDWLRRADDALFEAKHGGRNQTRRAKATNANEVTGSHVLSQKRA